MERGSTVSVNFDSLFSSCPLFHSWKLQESSSVLSMVYQILVHSDLLLCICNLCQCDWQISVFIFTYIRKQMYFWSSNMHYDLSWQIAIKMPSFMNQRIRMKSFYYTSFIMTWYSVSQTSLSMKSFWPENADETQN